MYTNKIRIIIYSLNLSVDHSQTQANKLFKTSRNLFYNFCLHTATVSCTHTAATGSITV